MPFINQFTAIKKNALLIVLLILIIIVSGEYYFNVIFAAETATGSNDPYGKSAIVEDLSIQLLASTFLGGMYTDLPYGPFIEVDDSGYVYISGFTASPDFPRTPGAFQTHYGGGVQDCFIAKFNNDLTELIASTYLGGSGFETECTIELDDEGNVYVAGYTNSTDFPVTATSYCDTNSGEYDIFIAKLSGDLSTLLASTYVGGSSNDGWESNRIDLETGSDGSLYIAAQSSSSDFPVTSNAYDSSYNGTGVYIFSGDAVAMKFAPGLDTLLASTFLGGDLDEYRVSLALDNADNVFVVTGTYSYGIQTPYSAYDYSYNGASEIYIYKLDSELATRLSATYFGASEHEVPHSAETDSAGNLYITGYTESDNYPVTGFSFDDTFGGVEDGFLAKFDNNLETLLASTFVGGSESDRGQAIKIAGQKMYLTGRTLSADFPATPHCYDSSLSGGIEHGDISVSVFDLDLSTLIASTYLGGLEDEKPLGMDVDNQGNIFIGGFSHSNGYPVTQGAYDTTFAGIIDVTIAKFNVGIINHIEESPSPPGGYQLRQNYPNPFNPSTVIKYVIPEPGYVEINIYDIAGRKLNTLVSRIEQPGVKSVAWNGTDSKGNSASSGIYYYTLQAGDVFLTKKMLLLR